MGQLDGKTALIVGVSNDRSIAWGIAQALHREGASIAFSYQPLMESRARPLAESLGATFIEPLELTSEDSLAEFMAKLQTEVGKLDVLVHSVAYANREDLMGRFVDTSRDGFVTALEVSCYSFVALTRAALPLLAEDASVLTMTYYGSQKVAPSYNVMGVAKAALEAAVRYMASDLGPQGIRVNAISAGPIRTLAASGIKGFRDYQKAFTAVAPLRRHVTTEDVGNTAVFLSSDAARGITGEVLYVDSGYNIMGLAVDQE
jgi:enoyl-[acyl-carrier protein] reductase I